MYYFVSCENSVNIFWAVFSFNCEQTAFQSYAFILSGLLTENSILKDRNNSSLREILNTKTSSFIPSECLVWLQWDKNVFGPQHWQRGQEWMTILFISVH